MKKIILTAGYGWSGSSAVVDLLREYQNISVIAEEFEFRLIKDPYGLEYLRQNVTDPFSILQVDNAILDFTRMVSRLSKREITLWGRIIRPGSDYERFFGQQFMRITYSFIEELIDFKYDGDDFKKMYRYNDAEYLIYKFSKRFKKFSNVFCNLTVQEYDSIVSQYLQKLFDQVMKGNEKEYLILDGAINAQNPWIADHYFKDWKMIIVDRDARDCCTSLMRHGGGLGKQVRKDRDMSKYIKYHKLARASTELLKEDDRILQLEFSDLINDYSNSVKIIENHLGLDPCMHNRKKKYFKPEVSRKNIGRYKQYLNDAEAKYITKELAKGL